MDGSSVLVTGDVLSRLHHPLESVTVQGGVAAIPGSDAASQDTLYSAPVEIAVNPGIHVEPLQPAEEEEPLSGHLPDGVCVVSPGQVIADVNPEEPEAADSLHRSPVDGEGACSTPGLFL